MAQRNQAIVVKAAAGSGKTTAYTKKVAQHVAANSSARVEIYVPTISLGEHVASLVRVANPNAKVIVIRGRSQQANDGTPMCQQTALANSLSGYGIPIYSTLCSPSSGTRCAHYSTCKHVSQFGGWSGVYIYTHAHLPLDRNWLEGDAPDLAIIDESFFAKCIDELRIDIASVQSSSVLPILARQFVLDIALALKNGRSIKDVWITYRRSRGGVGAIIKQLTGLVKNAAPLAAINSAIAIDVGLMVKVRRVIEHVVRSVAKQDSPQSIELVANGSSLICHVLKPITRLSAKYGRNVEVWIFDASADPLLIEPFFTIQVFKELTARRNAYVVQCHSTRCSTTSLVPGSNGNPVSSNRAQKHLQEIEALVSNLVNAHGRVLVAGPTKVVGNPTTGLQPLINIPPSAELAHFNALRGNDAWKDFDVILLLGRNQPPVFEVENISKALFAADSTPLNLSTGAQLTNQVRGYRMRNGSKVGVDVEVHPDVRVQAVMEQLRENESLQAIDRLRLIHCPKPKLVVILSNIPLDIEVDALVYWDDLMHGKRVEQALMTTGGVLPLAPEWLATHFSQLWPSADAAEKDVGRTLKNGHFVNSISIKKMSVFTYKYRLPGQRRHSTALTFLDKKAAVQSKLEATLGSPVHIGAKKTINDSGFLPDQ